MNDDNYLDDIEDILDNIDFDRIQDVMKFLHWEWVSPDGVGTRIPTIGELRKGARRILRNAAAEADKLGIEFTVASGGFFATAKKLNDKMYMRIHFEIQDSDNYE